MLESDRPSDVEAIDFDEASIAMFDRNNPGPINYTAEDWGPFKYGWTWLPKRSMEFGHWDWRWLIFRAWSTDFTVGVELSLDRWRASAYVWLAWVKVGIDVPMWGWLL